MSLNEFKGIWTVTTEGPEKGHRIAIGGSLGPGKVKVLCIDNEGGHEYSAFTYQLHPELLQGLDGASTLELERGTPNQIHYESALTPGSWTAEDNNGAME